MAGKGHGIKVYKAQKRKKKNRREKFTAVCLSSVFVSFLGAAWWNAFLSVFALDLNETWLYGGICLLSLFVSFLIVCAGKWTVIPTILAAPAFLWVNEVYGTVPGAGEAVLTLPVLILWIFVFLSGKGKLLSGLVLAAPFAVSAWAGYFPSAQSAWILIFAGAMYYASSALGTSDTRKYSADNDPGAMRQGARRMAGLLFTAGGFALMVWISVSAGRLLDTGRQEEGSVYQTVRARIHKNLIGRIERMTESRREDTGEQPVPEDAVLEEAEQAQENDVLTEEGQSEVIFGDDPASSEDSMDHLKEISAFVPETLENPYTVALQEKPSGTVYVPLRTGTAYTGESWERGNDPGEVLPEEMPDFLEDCLMFPEGMNRLEELCESWDTSSVEAVGRQIDETFVSMAVYDTAPGPVPEDEDFAEYFLFENHRGFCVHFATTAALLYRMCGYPSVYIEGYAVPASAFKQTEDGSWQAQVEGSMGHAWCQVYEGSGNGWENKEHTPAARENENAAERIAGAEGSPETVRKTPFSWQAVTAATALSLLLVTAAAILVRAAFRRKRFRQEIADAAEGNGIPAMYEGIIKMAGLARGSVPGPGNRKDGSANKKPAGIFGTERMELLKKEYPQISAAEWDWFYEQVMRALYYHLDDGTKTRERAYRIYRKCTEAAWERMTSGSRLLCRYVHCISPENGKKIKRK